MIERAALLGTLKPVVTALEGSIRTRVAETPEVAEHLASEHRKAIGATRTAMSLEEWSEGEITQAAVAWVLGCVFVRFLEDNEMVDQPLISGPGRRRTAALGQREEHFRSHPADSDREYLEACFRQVAAYRVVAPLYDERHNPLWRLGPTADGARMLRETFSAIKPETGLLEHDFADLALRTRFLGDLYQDLSEAAQKRYALLQTPDFVERLILDRTLDPAIDEFGLHQVRLIDPTCGSGHFLIGAFERLFARWQEREPATSAPVLAQRCLDQIAGVDLNPYATAIARFRLLVTALRASGIKRLAEAPAFTLHLATGDSLLHGPLPSEGATMLLDANRLTQNIAHVFEAEDAGELKQILGRGYHAVVGNPPYIKVQDPALRAAIKARYSSCSGQWVLTVPFMERFVELAVTPQGAGHVGKVTGSSFSKREFGKKLVREHFRSWNVSAVYDVSGIHLPGHGTDVMLIFGTAEPPTTSSVLFGLKEAGDPADAVNSPAWDELVEHQQDEGFQGQYFAITRVQRERLATHPWSFGTSGSQAVLEQLLQASTRTVADIVVDLGFGAISGADPVFFGSDRDPGFGGEDWRPTVGGDDVRDWQVCEGRALVTFGGPDAKSCWPAALADQVRLWRARPILARRLLFGTPITETALEWFAWRETYPAKLNAGPAIAFGEITTRNQFAPRRLNVVTTQTAPLMILSTKAVDTVQFELLEYLNSSTACFYFMQVCAKKGANVSKKRTRDERFVFNARSVSKAPLPPVLRGDLAKALMRLSAVRRRKIVAALDAIDGGSLFDVARDLEREDEAAVGHLRFVQEEIDWAIYARFGLCEPFSWPVDEPQVLNPGERAFEIRLARDPALQADAEAWFERDRIARKDVASENWSPSYARLVNSRIEAISNSRALQVLEQPRHKRRWLLASAAEELRSLCRAAVAAEIEDLAIWDDCRLHSVSEIADALRRDTRLVDRVRFSEDNSSEGLSTVCGRIFDDLAVSEPSATRYSASGLEKHTLWKRAWKEQRATEQSLGMSSAEPTPPIPVLKAQAKGFCGSFAPPEFSPEDFTTRSGWAIRGKLDMPNERFFRVFGAEKAADVSAVCGKAAWTSVERARAIATRVVELHEDETQRPEDALVMLAAVDELLPWIHQWHPESDPLYSGPPGQYFEGWLDGQLAELAVTRDTLRSWQPPAVTRGRRAKATSP